MSAHTLTPNQVKFLRQEFTKFDLDNCGEISFDEMKFALSSFKDISMEDMEKIFHQLDFDHTGKIRYHEFLAGAISRRNLTETNLKLTFEKMSHRTNQITRKDVELLLGCDYSPGDIQDMWEEEGLEDDETIDYEKFKSIILGDSSSPPPEPSDVMVRPGSSSCFYHVKIRNGQEGNSLCV